ncbi:hypothetical protein [Pedobacter sp. Leaf170]|uniref:hypothetical protein n=1 Tax=Pedobacter sp. Leaf170 TaxID=2876558 RepID=UPI001E46A8E8|nr:hypothetical protein [Pedobacter sp. Leaf170]
MKVLFALICIFLFNSDIVHAATGCVSQNSGYLYFNLRSTQQKPGVPNYTWRNNADRNLTPSSSYCLTNRRANNTCFIVNDTGSSTGSFDGYLVDYGPLPCPIDDYIPFLILPIGLIGFCYMQNRSFYCKNPA